MLSPLDDLLAHQTPDTFDHVVTSDRNFYDRYYFNLHSSSDELFMITGMGQYPNLGTTDAFAVIGIEGKQYLVRASRELGSDRLNTTIGPFSVKVIEGLRKLQVKLEPNEWGFDFDLTFEGAIPPVEEPRMVNRMGARLIMDTSRLTQTGYWSGVIHVAGKTFNVTPDRWRGARDHSWGVRPVGEPEAPGIRGKLQPRGSMWNWVPMQFDDFTIFYMASEGADGTRTLEEAVKYYNYDSGKAPEHLGSPRHDYSFGSGTRIISGGTITFPSADGKDLVVKITPLKTVFLFVGTGYGRDPDWVHGMYQGELKVQGFEFDINDPDFIRRAGTFNEMLSRFELDGHVGYGMLEHSFNGDFDRYGLKGATGAP